MLFNSHRPYDSQNQDISDINIVPMVDVMLVLLVIFMISAPLSLTGVKVNVPVSRSTPKLTHEAKVVLTIDSKGNYYIDQVQIPAKYLTAKIKALFEHRDKKDLYIRADKSVLYSHVVDAMSAARVAGVYKLSMITRAPDKK